VLQRVESRRFGEWGRSEGGADGRDSTPYIGAVLPPWATALGILLPCSTAAGTWPHRPVEPTVGVTSNVVPHSGRNSSRRGVRRQMYISQKFWLDHLFFEKSWQNKYIKKFDPLNRWEKTMRPIKWRPHYGIHQFVSTGPPYNGPCLRPLPFGPSIRGDTARPAPPPGGEPWFQLCFKDV
jgi:hypothetical protein